MIDYQKALDWFFVHCNCDNNKMYSERIKNGRLLQNLVDSSNFIKKSNIELKLNDLMDYLNMQDENVDVLKQELEDIRMCYSYRLADMEDLEKYKKMFNSAIEYISNIDTSKTFVEWR